MIGSNAVHLQVTVDEAAGRLVAVGAVDNLAKGTARRRRPVHEPRARPRREHRALHRGAGAVTARRPTFTLEQFPEKLAVVRLGPGRRGPRVGRVVLAVLDHRDRHRDLAWSARPAACRRRREQPAAVHRVRGRGPARLRADRRARRAAGAARRGGDQRLHASRPSTPTGSWSRSTTPTRAAEAWRRAGHERRRRRPRPSRPQEEAEQMSVTQPRRLPRRRRRRRARSPPAPRTSPWSSTTARRTTPPPSSPPTAARPTRSCGARRSSRTASSAPSCSTPAAPTATPAPRASRPPTPSPSRWPTGLGIGAIDVVVCSTGLIGLANPREHAARRASTLRTPRWPTTAGTTPPRRS